MTVPTPRTRSCSRPSPSAPRGSPRPRRCSARSGARGSWRWASHCSLAATGTRPPTWMDRRRRAGVPPRPGPPRQPRDGGADHRRLPERPPEPGQRPGITWTPLFRERGDGPWASRGSTGCTSRTPRRGLIPTTRGTSSPSGLVLPGVGRRCDPRPRARLPVRPRRGAARTRVAGPAARSGPNRERALDRRGWILQGARPPRGSVGSLCGPRRPPAGHRRSRTRCPGAGSTSRSRPSQCQPPSDCC